MSAENKESVVDTVQVVLRIRPLVESEVERGCDECVEVIQGEPQVQVKDLAFTYNYVFPPHIGQQEFYDTAVKNLVLKLFDGYNVTILAYGQTGSGKTYSMGTNCTGCDGDSNNKGVIPQAVRDIFDYVKNNEAKFTFKVGVSFMELYQEQCYDLLSGKQRNHSIVEIREDHRGVVLPGLSEIPVTSEMDTMQCLMRGSEGRAVGATAMNAFSSRSHAIFTICIYKESLTNKNQATTSKFHLVDLAGSERTKKTKATGDRLKEGIKINQGLLALGNVISALGDGTNRGYICYRESKLTRLLQDSLGGNSVTLMIACVSPADYNLEETVSTLRYADRARRIRNKPVVNQDAKAAEIIRLNNLVNELRLQLLGKAPVNYDSPDCTELLEKERTKYNELLAKHKHVTEMLNLMFMDNASHCEKALMAEAAKEKIEKKLNELTEKCNQTIENINQTFDKSVDGESPREQVIEQLKEMKNQLEELQSESAKYNEELMEHEIRGSNGVKSEDNDSLGDIQVEDEEGALIQNEAHAMDRVAMNKELNELNQAMAIKATVVKQMMANTRDLLEYNDNLKENEAKVAALEKEKNELLQQLKNVQTKMKDPLTEERRTKVQALEHEIADLRKKCQHQANLIRLKERNEAKITALNNEIQNMKVTKVNLLKRMRVESEKFRRWKAESERDVCRLRAADRKRANAMARMESMHAKQQNVMKRKMEETVAVNRRLKEALERQKQTQLKRGKGGAVKAEAVQQWLEQELEIQLSTVDAQRTLQDLMEDRRIIMVELERLRSQDEDPGKICEMENELQLRKAQISDLQHKILTADQENVARTRWETLQSMVEAKCALKFLFESLLDTKKEMQLSRNTQQEANYQQLQEEHEALMREHKQITKEYERQLAVMEMQHEEKLSALISLGRGVTVSGMSTDAVKTLQGHVDLQRERLDKLEAENEQLRMELELLRTSKKHKKEANLADSKTASNENKSSSGHLTPKKYADITDEEVSDTDSEKDPDWRATPMYRRIRAQRSRLTAKFAETLDSKTLESKSLLRAGVKRGSDGAVHCSCRGSCDKRLCSCRKADTGCGELCKCPRVLCKNRRSEDADDKENTPVEEEVHSNLALDRPTLLESKVQHDGTFVKKPKYYFYPPEEENKNSD